MGARKVSAVGSGEVTIDLIAKSAGVSRATVSRVMNGSAKVSPEREKAVKKAIAKYNFTPNLLEFYSICNGNNPTNTAHVD